MADQYLLSQLHYLFPRLSAEQLEWVASCSQILRCTPGQILFAQGQNANGPVTFINGTGHVTQVGADTVERIIAVAGVGQTVNEGALYQDMLSPFSLRAADSALVLFISRPNFLGVLQQRPDIYATLTGATAPQPPPAAQAQPSQYAARPQPAAAPAAAAQPAQRPIRPQQAAAPAAPVEKSGKFISQRPDEKIVLETRRHWWAFGSKVWTLAFLAALLVAGALAGTATNPNVPWWLMAVPLLILIGLGMIFMYLEWANDQFILTDRRVLSINRQIVGFKTYINELPLDGIHEVSLNIPGTDVFARLFNYGTVVIRTSGDEVSLRLDTVPNPRRMQDLIFQTRDRWREQRTAQMHEVIDNPVQAQLAPALSRGGFLSTHFTNERGETVYRKHVSIWISHVVFPIGMTIAGIIGFAASAALPSLAFVGFGVSIVAACIGVLWFAWADWDWRNDLYIINDHTITLIHRRPLWLQDSKDQILLSQVDNVVSEISGLTNSLLKMGNVKMLLSGSNEQNAKYFRNVYNPQEIQQEISHRQERAEIARDAADAVRQRQAIVNYLTTNPNQQSAGRT